VKIKPDIVNLWQCPTCGRRFERQGQAHSCRAFSLEQHFKGKPGGKLLYDLFKKAVKKQLGVFKIESLECCIHFVSTFTFAGVKIFKDKIRVDFSLSRKLKSKRIDHLFQMSANRYLYAMDILKEADIDEELIGWIKEARDKKRANAAAVA
jgi:hypothetical protein